jgi:hypothetical protein
VKLLVIFLCKINVEASTGTTAPTSSTGTTNDTTIVPGTLSTTTSQIASTDTSVATAAFTGPASTGTTGSPTTDLTTEIETRATASFTGTLPLLATTASSITNYSEISNVTTVNNQQNGLVMASPSSNYAFIGGIVAAVLVVTVVIIVVVVFRQRARKRLKVLPEFEMQPVQHPTLQDPRIPEASTLKHDEMEAATRIIQKYWRQLRYHKQKSQSMAMLRQIQAESKQVMESHNSHPERLKFNTHKTLMDLKIKSTNKNKP